MIDKVKLYVAVIQKYALLILGGALGLVTALLLRQSRKTDAVKSELAGALNDTEIKLNDQAREAARANADALVYDYHKLRGDDR